MKAVPLSTSEIFRQIKSELLIFLTIFAGWLLYALSAHLYYQPVALDAETLILRMFYMSLQTYFVLALVRFTSKGLDKKEK